MKPLLDSLAAALAWLEAHPVLAWLLITGALNTIFRTRTAAEWERFKRQWPRLAAVIQLLRSAGLDPNKLRAWLVTLATRQLPPPPAFLPDLMPAAPLQRPDDPTLPPHTDRDAMTTPSETPTAKLRSHKP